VLWLYPVSNTLPRINREAIAQKSKLEVVREAIFAEGAIRQVRNRKPSPACLQVVETHRYVDVSSRRMASFSLRMRNLVRYRA
jgi:hypothetical protein